ncbi:hypothetical protein JB92DRAFT_3129507 [Gautieria morchelliformis]|nr:hypothetical protein JB92DRAFT_3129507 [Gautieria morchelliformis]
MDPQGTASAPPRVHRAAPRRPAPSQDPTRPGALQRQQQQLGTLLPHYHPCRTHHNAMDVHEVCTNKHATARPSQPHGSRTQRHARDAGIPVSAAVEMLRLQIERVPEQKRPPLAKCAAAFSHLVGQHTPTHNAVLPGPVPTSALLCLHVLASTRTPYGPWALQRQQRPETQPPRRTRHDVDERARGPRSGGNAEVAKEPTLTQRWPPLAKHAAALPHLVGQHRPTARLHSTCGSRIQGRAQTHSARPRCHPDDVATRDPHGTQARQLADRHATHPGLVEGDRVPPGSCHVTTNRDTPPHVGFAQLVLTHAAFHPTSEAQVYPPGTYPVIPPLRSFQPPVCLRTYERCGACMTRRPSEATGSGALMTPPPAAWDPAVALRPTPHVLLCHERATRTRANRRAAVYRRARTHSPMHARARVDIPSGNLTAMQQQVAAPARLLHLRRVPGVTHCLASPAPRQCHVTPKAATTPRSRRAFRRAAGQLRARALRLGRRVRQRGRQRYAVIARGHNNTKCDCGDGDAAKHDEDPSRHDPDWGPRRHMHQSLCGLMQALAGPPERAPRKEHAFIAPNSWMKGSRMPVRALTAVPVQTLRQPRPAQRPAQRSR